ncbi:MAG: response regulator [Alphaproteobacteria bacterium]
MATELNERRVFDLASASVLVFERSPEQAKVAAHLVRGFGAFKVRETCKFDDAQAYARSEPLDLIIADPEAAKGRAMEFLRWLRRAETTPNRCVPIILTADQTANSLIKVLRDAGANFIIAKPYRADTLLNRINWVGKDKRPFVVAEGYVGPCRRISPGGVPLGRGRRAADALVLAAEERKREAV